MRPRPVFAALATALTIAATHDLFGGGTSAWTLRQQAPVLLSIGVETGDSLYEFTQVSGAVRLSNGNIVVANSGTSQLRWYDSAGRYIRTTGRRGRGPFEFAGPINVYAGAADSVIAFDMNGRRFHVLDRGGKFVRTDTAPDQSIRMWVARHTIVERMPTAMDSASIHTSAGAVPLVQGQLLQRAIPDSSGALWVRPRVGGVWIGYRAGGRAIGSIALPVTFEPFQIGDTWVLGADRDELGVDRVQLRRIVRRPAPSGAPRLDSAVTRSETERESRKAEFAAMRSDLRNARTAMEAYQQRRGTYASTLRSLNFVPSNSVRIDVLPGAANGYWLIASSPELRSICVLGVGVSTASEQPECL